MSKSIVEYKLSKNYSKGQVQQLMLNFYKNRSTKDGKYPHGMSCWMDFCSKNPDEIFQQQKD